MLGGRQLGEGRREEEAGSWCKRGCGDEWISQEKCRIWLNEIRGGTYSVGPVIGWTRGGGEEVPPALNHEICLVLISAGPVLTWIPQEVSIEYRSLRKSCVRAETRDR